MLALTAKKSQKYGGYWDFSNKLHTCIQIQHNTKHKINILFCSQMYGDEKIHSLFSYLKLEGIF